MKISFLTPVQHDSDCYQIGETADLPDKVAKTLIASLSAEPARSAKADTKGKLEQKDEPAADAKEGQA